MDLNLLRVLDVLLQESSVTRAAERLGTSPPAVSRALAQLRRQAGDPLLVRAGQGLVPTQRAVDMRQRLSGLLAEADEILRPGAQFDPSSLRRAFTVQSADLFVSSVAAPLLQRLSQQAPGVDVIFVSEALEDTGLRRGDVDLELGVLGHLDPETHHRSLTRTELLGVARAGNPLFAAEISVDRFAAAEHIGTSRRGRAHGPIDTALAAHGLRRRVRIVVSNHTSALLLAGSTDLVALTTAHWASTIESLGMRTFAIPLDLPPLEIGIAWHPRTEDDAAHRWFRQHVATTFESILAAGSD
ncbi:LysR family transcriptional regulator [Mycobacterium sp. shizuoka-1]|uniref:LysR family transcriptional regulator n=1 Tax=Mycobacterium sp. shizuoka-1 TaxID=2039281 RepID=UPI000C05F344|nr:LysR family transcriptional regulator [Mycobacterium sp. shizuoka-1]GAY17836.1 putative transcriptional regulator, LysR family protein [Mycobacterium sp. shizuoka-1]